jgi:hypothetical protein
LKAFPERDRDLDIHARLEEVGMVLLVYTCNTKPHLGNNGSFATNA